MYHGVEKRRFFRITDRLRIGYALLSEVSEEQEASLISRDGGYDLEGNFDDRIQALIDAACMQQPAIAELAELINKKLNFIISYLGLDPQTITNIDHNIREVNISACGIAFSNHEPLQIDQKVKIDLLLLPENLYIPVIAKVVACEVIPKKGAEAEAGGEAAGETDGEGGQRYYLRFDFDRINLEDQELLIQHTVKRQAFMLKTQREAEGEDAPE